MLAGLTPSIGSVGDAYDNALAETTIGLYKTEAVCKDSPFRRGPLNRLADVELLTADWVHWYNTSRLMHRLGRTPPVEYEAAHYAERATARRRHTSNQVCTKAGAVHVPEGIIPDPPRHGSADISSPSSPVSAQRCPTRG